MPYWGLYYACGYYYFLYLFAMDFALALIVYSGPVPTPIHSPLPKDVSFSSLTQQSTLFIQKSALQNLEEIGEGMIILLNSPSCYILL